MQNEVRVSGKTSPVVFGSDNVRLPTHPSQWPLRLDQEPVKQPDPGGRTSDSAHSNGLENSSKLYDYRKLHNDLQDQGRDVPPEPGRTPEKAG